MSPNIYSNTKRPPTADGRPPNPRFTSTNPPHPDCPALTDWHLFDHGQRISVDQLVQRANALQRELNQLKVQLTT